MTFVSQVKARPPQPRTVFSLADIMAPKAVTSKQLHKIAAAATISLGKEFGQTVRGKYLGQRFNTRSGPKYRSDPATWVVEENERHSQTVISFAFQRGGDDTEWATREVACKNAVGRGVPAPESWLQPSVSLADLDKLAAAASKRLSKEFGQAVLCKYLGQHCGGPKSTPKYISDPEAWVGAEAEWHSQTVITFAFQRGGDAAAWTTQEVACHNAFARGVLPPDAWMQPCVTLADLEKLAAAAGRLLSKEFGEAVLCKYRGQRCGPDGDPEYRRAPAEWVVADGGRHSRTVITFAFQCGGDEAPWTTQETACHNCLARGPSPPQVWKHVDMQLLRSAAAASARKESRAVAHFAVPPISCMYIGQKQILPSHAVRYEPDPEKWHIPEGESLAPRGRK